MRIVNGGCPEHLFEQVRPHIEAWSWLVPPWVDAVRVMFRADDDGTISTNVVEEYRNAYVYIAAGWGKVPEAERGRWVMHELLHIPVDAIHDAFVQLLQSTTEGGSPLNEWASETGRKGVERTVNDLERSLWERLGPDA